MALLLALAVNVGVGTMVESFSRTFLVWLDGRLAADVYVSATRRRAGDRDQGLAARAARGRGDPARRPRRRAIRRARRSRFSACPITPPIASTGRCLKSADNAWVRLRPGRCGPVSEQLARRLKLRIGDRIEVPAPGGNWPLEIVGIYADYGNPKGQIAVNYAALTRRFPDIPATRFGLRVAPPKIPALISALREKFELDDRSLADQATMKAELKRIFNRTFAVTAALNAFTLGVAGIALLTSLLTLGNSRLPQLAPLWAIGITRRRLAAIELIKTLSVALITASAGAAARPAGGVVPDRGGECKGVRLAAAVSCVPVATARTPWRCDGGIAAGRPASSDKTGAHAAGQPDQDFCR